MDYFEWFPKRLMQLRTEKNVSARDMSLSLGQSESYINKIENRHALPSMQTFFYICEYLDIEPSAFFSTDVDSPSKQQEISRKIGRLTAAQAEHIIQLIDDLTGK